MIRRLAIGGSVLWTLAASTHVAAQGSRVDYERAAELDTRTRDAVFRDRVRVRWVSDSAGWYRVDVGPDRHEYVWIDADLGERRPAFDHGRVAGALAVLAGEWASPTALPISRIDAEGDDLLLSAFGRRWRWSEAGQLTEVEQTERSVVALSPSRAPGRSRFGSEESRVVFINRSGVRVSLWWLDGAGQRQAYGSLEPDERRSQGTYAGHVWIVTNEVGGDHVAFVAEDEPLVAEIPVTPPEPPPVVDDPPRGLSPDGRSRAFLRDENLVVVDVVDGREVVVTRDGHPHDAYREPFWWSPDSRRLVAMKVASGEEREIHFVEAAPRDQLQPKLHTLRYAKPGDRLPRRRPVLVDVASGEAVQVDDALFDNPWSLTDLSFDQGGRRFTFLYNQRGHQVLRVIAVDARSGVASVVIEERSDTFVDYAHKVHNQRLDTGDILWMSERDGWNHLYRIDGGSGAVKNQVTRGEWVVRRVERVDEESGQVWFWAGGIVPDQDPYHLHLCRVGLDGEDLQLLTQGDGNHAVEFSPDRRYFIDTWSRVDHPPVTELRRSDDGALVMELERADWSALLDTGWSVPERFVAKGRDGETDIHGILIRPSNFDPERRYPVVEQIYAGPHGAHVPKSFGRLLGQHRMAELGFVVVQIDGMGTSYRSKRFHDVCWKNLADSGFPDRIAWLRAAAAQYPQLDLSRVGIYGGSAGGQSAMRALIDHGHFYKVAVADCGCHDNRVDKVWWNELWMGWPIGEEYEACSNVAQAHRMQGELLLIVGEVDRNVDPGSTMQVVDALVRADKDFDLLVLPGVGHGAAETPYGSRRRADFLVRHLHGVESRWEP